jgi:hypothetical protein
MAPIWVNADHVFCKDPLLWARWLYAGSVISSFRNTFTAVAPVASEHLEVVNTALVRSLFEDPQFEGFLVDAEPGKIVSTTPDYEELGRKAASKVFESSYASLDAAVLVFYHSLLDGLAFDCCRTTALHAPQDWAGDLKDARVRLVDTKGKTHEQLFQERLNEHLMNLERESLLAKINRLFARCSPPSGWSPYTDTDFKFDKNLLERFDKQRHAIIHGRAFGKNLAIFAESSESLDYLLKAGIYLLALISFKYHLRLDPSTLESLRGNL